MVTSSLKIEKSLWKLGYNMVCGLDEVGRGSFAGPLVVGAVIFPKDSPIPDGVADSKLLRPRVRQKLAREIKKCAACWAVSEISVSVIDKVGIGEATQVAFRRAIKLLPIRADFVLIDAFYIKHFNRKNQRPIKNGDKICASISAASIIAKVHRDGLMKKLSRKYPQYGFGKHKGYGTRRHRDMIKKYGLSKIHRRSFDRENFRYEH